MKFLIKRYCFNHYNLSLYFNETKTKLNIFLFLQHIYIAFVKHCWEIKLGEFKSDQKYFAR